MMPPIRKPGIDKIHASPKSFLSKSASSGTLQQEFLNHPKVNLSNSCFGAIRTVKDDDLTSLNWLQNRDILKGFDVAKSVPPMSPPDDGDGELTDLLLRGGDVNGDSSSEHCSNKKKSPSKPPYSFSSLIFMAIEESSGKRLPVKDIYSWIMEHFPYFRDAPLGWKNSVRHNLSLNKCFKKVDKEKGQNVGKGSLWTVDPDYRINLVQALRKTPAFHPYQHLLTTPPPSPQNGGSTSSTPRSLSYGTRTSGLDDRTQTLEEDLDAEAEAVATICLISTPPEVRAAEIVRCQSCPPSDSDKEDLIKQAKEVYYKHYYRHRSSFSGIVSTAKHRISSLAKESGRRHSNRKYGLSSSFGKLESKLSRSDITPNSSVDSALGLDQNSDSEDDEDSEIEEAMEKVVKRELNDSGYGQDFEEPTERKRRRKEVSKAQSRKGRTNSTDEKLSDYAGADALLKLANSAFLPVKCESPVPIAASSVTS